MNDSPHEQLGRRERQIMDALYRLGRASVAEVRAALADPPGYSAVRTFLNLLEEKGLVAHHSEGRKYVYRPTVPREKARRSAVNNLLQTFFDDSVEQAVATLLSQRERRLTQDQLDRLEELIREARKDGR